MKTGEIEVGGYYKGKDRLVRKVVDRYLLNCTFYITFVKAAGPKGRHTIGAVLLATFARWARRRLTPAEVEQVERGRAAEKGGQG